MTIVTFEDGSLGDASAELRALGTDFALDILLHCQKVHNRKIDYRKLQPFDVYRGVEMFQASIGSKFIVFSVESDFEGGLKLTIIFAGQHGLPAQAGKWEWNGYDYDAFRAGILRARAAKWFD
jgi:hypothetical protein